MIWVFKVQFSIFHLVTEIFGITLGWVPALCGQPVVKSKYLALFECFGLKLSNVVNVTTVDKSLLSDAIKTQFLTLMRDINPQCIERGNNTAEISDVDEQHAIILWKRSWHGKKLPVLAFTKCVRHERAFRAAFFVGKMKRKFCTLQSTIKEENAFSHGPYSASLFLSFHSKKKAFLKTLNILFSHRIRHCQWTALSRQVTRIVGVFATSEKLLAVRAMPDYSRQGQVSWC